MFDISEKLIVGQSDEIYGVNPIQLGVILHGNHLSLVMKKSSVSCTQRSTYFQIVCYCGNPYTILPCCEHSCDAHSTLWILCDG